MNAVCSPGARDARHLHAAERENKLGENTRSQSHPAANTGGLSERVLSSFKGLPFPSSTCKIRGKKGERWKIQKIKRMIAFMKEEQGPEMLWGAGWDQGNPGAVDRQ